MGEVGGTCIKIVDADGNTKIEVEKTADEDIIRMTTGGTEVIQATSTEITHKAGTLKTNSGTLVFGTEYSLPETDGISGDVLSIDNTGEAVWRNPAAALGLVVGIETASFANIMGSHSLQDEVFYVRVMPWSNIRVTKMAFLLRSSTSATLPQIGIYDNSASPVLLASGTAAASIPNPAPNSQLVEISLNAPYTLVAGQIYWFALVDKNNGGMTVWRYTADAAAEFSTRMQLNQTQLPNPATPVTILGTSDKGIWMAAY
ncbi:MAG: hypothetical protein IPO21_14660 [Bacteroidales bacterium]|nr:hypothetical protein [Bacteroidales bacterium]